MTVVRPCVLILAAASCQSEQRLAHRVLDDCRFQSAIVAVESGGNPRAVGDGGEAVGLYQIRPVLVEDLNRIAGRPKWRLGDRWDPSRSRQMFVEYLGHYGNAYYRRVGVAPTAEVYARMWNGGPRGYVKKSTWSYWQKVDRKMQSVQSVGGAK